MRLSLAVAVACLSAIGLSTAADVHAAIKKDTTIPAQGLGPALQQLAKDRDVSLLFLSEDVRDKQTSGAVGELTFDEALTKLLSGSGLTFKYLDETTVTILPLAEAESPGVTGSPAPNTSPSNETAATKREKSFLNRFRLAQATEGNAAANERTAQSRVETAPRPTQIEEIIVTAQKREQRLQDVPMSITAVTGEDIDRRSLVNAADYLRGIPGVNQVDTALNQTIVIRGIETATTFQNYGSGPTTATYFGETPTTNAAGLFGGTNVDLKLVDIERVEVLRGPQGTAFGNSSLGGAVRTIPVAPKLDRAEGRVATSYSVTSGSGGDNYNVQAVGNLPLIQDRLAIRAAVYQFEDSGYYTNRAGSDPAFQAWATQWGALGSAVDENEVGSYFTRGGRLAALFQATDDLKLTLSYLTQKTEADGVIGSNDGDYGQTEFQISPAHAKPGQTGGYANTDIDILNATLDSGLGWGNLLATFSYVDGGSTSATNILTFPASQYADSHHKEYVGEIRLSTQFDGPWNFLGGIYVEEIKDDAVADNQWYADPATILVPPGPRGPLDLGIFPETRNLKQKAAFGEASWELIEGLTLTGGVRAYQYDRSYRLDASGGFYGAGGIHENQKGDDSGANYRANLSYKPTEDALLYAGWSQGFRLGRLQAGLASGQCDLDGDNIVDGTDIPISSTRALDPDELDNYELGAKFDLLDNRVRISADVFRMRWSKMPVRVTPVPAGQGTCGGLSYFANVGSATSEGVEFEANVQLSAPLRVYLGGSWIDATVDEDEPGLNASAGARLPGSPKVNANLGLEYAFSIGGYEAFVRTDSIYVGEFFSSLPESPNVKAGDYFKLDATARVAIRNLSVELFARNLTNEDGFTYSDSILNRYQLRPRTFGLQLAYNFGGQ